MLAIVILILISYESLIIKYDCSNMDHRDGDDDGDVLKQAIWIENFGFALCVSTVQSGMCH